MFGAYYIPQDVTCMRLMAEGGPLFRSLGSVSWALFRLPVPPRFTQLGPHYVHAQIACVGDRMIVRAYRQQDTILLQTRPPCLKTYLKQPSGSVYGNGSRKPLAHRLRARTEMHCLRLSNPPNTEPCAKAPFWALSASSGKHPPDCSWLFGRQAFLTCGPRLRVFDCSLPWRWEVRSHHD